MYSIHIILLFPVYYTYSNLTLMHETNRYTYIIWIMYVYPAANISYIINMI